MLRALDRQLAALGEPPADRPVWARYLAAREALLTAVDAFERAALAANVDAFVKAVQRASAARHDGAISALVFGAPGCIF